MGDKYPDVLMSMKERHALWGSKLLPLIESGLDCKSLMSPIGWGWVIDGNVEKGEGRLKAKVKTKR